MFAPVRLGTIVLAGSVMPGAVPHSMPFVAAGDSLRPASEVVAFASIFSGGVHSCALTGEGQAFCWGANQFGQVGVDSSGTCIEHDSKGKERVIACVLRPVAVSGSQRFTTLAVGHLHSCGITAEGNVYCWGDNTFGQLGADSVRSSCAEGELLLPCSHVPVAVAGDLRFSMLTAGRFHTCGVTNDGSVYCWGNHTNGELGTAEPFENCGLLLRMSKPAPCKRKPAVVPDIRAIGIDAGSFHTCILAPDSTAHCWGYGFQANPVPIPDARKFTSLQAGETITCGLATDRIPWCWGTFVYPFASLRISGTRPVKGGYWPDKSPDSYFTSITVGGAHICGLAVGGQAFCWGRGTEGQLGTRARLGPLVSNERWTGIPVVVEGELRFSSLSAGRAHTCGMATDGRPYCWGFNQVGQLGDGSTTTRETPTPVLQTAVAMRRP